MANKWAYLFKEIDQAESRMAGNWDRVRALLGGKGANLGEMTRVGIPVPSGFTVTTEACLAYLRGGEVFPASLWQQVLEQLDTLEQESGKGFGDISNPLLLSCRSGAKFSMPGMMDTVLNIGLNDETVQGIALLSGDERFAFDLYRRLLQMFGHVVLDIPDEAFEQVITAARLAADVRYDSELSATDWREVVDSFKQIIQIKTGKPFPQEPLTQLRMAIQAVFKSWNGKRAVDYRRAAGISNDLGTAVNIQTMVFGNMGEQSGTGVLFTRNPATGEDELYGDYLMNAQGEDVVAGIRQVEAIATLAHEMPHIYEELLQISKRMEQHFHNVQDMEFTIERGKLWILQTRDGKRSAKAAVKFAVDMANEGLISRQEAVKLVLPQQVETFLHPRFDEKAKKRAIEAGLLLAIGINASPGAAVGVVIFDADRAEISAKAGKSVIMVRPETKPDDVHGMLASRGILTSHGGNSSHAAIVARQFGVPAVVGCAALQIDLLNRQLTVEVKHKDDNGQLTVEEQVVHEGDTLSIDGTSGQIFIGSISTVRPTFDDPDLVELLAWADEFRQLGVRANADYPDDAQRARDFGAEGIGLCRTEHMFFQEERLPIVQEMILAENEEIRQQALDQLLPLQREDFKGLFEVMEGLPVIIRLIDPPLHEFLPDYDKLLANTTRDLIMGGDPVTLAKDERLLRAIKKQRETNPMLGLRGVRLGIEMPSIMDMQVRAIFEAACESIRDGVDVRLKIMIPLVSHVNELNVEQRRLETVAQEIIAKEGFNVSYEFGTMIELPRAALTANQIAEVAEFFSYGTNDLTQTTFGISRDDAESEFLMDYIETGILPTNPFQTIDRDGVGELIRIGVEKGRATRPDIEIGICGEHGGDPASIQLCHDLDLDYVSCSPFRVPVARLAAAHAALTEQDKLDTEREEKFKFLGLMFETKAKK